MSSHVLPILGIAIGLTALTLFSRPSAPAPDGPVEPRTDAADPTYDPPADPSVVAKAIVDEFLSQVQPSNRGRFEKLLRERLVRQVASDGWQILLPVDVYGAPPFDRVRHIASALGESYVVPVDVSMIVLRRRWPFAIVTVGPVSAEPDLSGLSEDGFNGTAERYGGLVDLIVNTVVASAVGTVTSMGVQDLVRSMGGERRLARIMRHYRRAEQRGDERTMAKVRRKVTRTASRIKGRLVDWSEVEALVGDGSR